MNSCPHVETTTLQWLWGEGPEDHVHHVARCGECQRVIEEHEGVLGAVSVAATPTRAVSEELEQARQPGGRRRGLMLASALALAAALVLFVRPPADTSHPGKTGPVDTGVIEVLPDPKALLDASPLFADSLDQDLAALDIELSWMAAELSPGAPSEEP